MDTLTLIQPDDWHLHVRDGAALAAVLPDSCRQMARAIIMPNLKPPVTSVALADAYRQRILAARPVGSDFEPLMTLYLTDNTPPQEIMAAKASGFIHAVKLYPAGATTNSAAGVTQVSKVMPTLEKMAELGMPLLMHGEVTDAEIDIFDREAVFIDTVLQPLRRQLPELKIVFEHITTAQAAAYVADADGHIGATVTPQHLLLNRNHLLVGGIQPHHYCLPVLKRDLHRRALLNAVSGPQAHRFFLGTDSAPHARGNKECACGCAGVYSAHTALELYAEVFDSIGAMDRLEAFASRNGPAFYGLPLNQRMVTLRRESWQVPEKLAYSEDVLIPLRAGQALGWRLITAD